MAIKNGRRCSVVFKVHSIVRLLSVPFLILMLSSFLSGCSDNEITSEAKIKAVVESAVKTVEQKELGRLADVIAESYSDQYGNNRKNALKMLRLYFLRNRSIYLFTQIKSIDLLGDEQQKDLEQSSAQIKVYVGMAGTPISNGIPVGVRANLFLFDLKMVEEDSEWLVQQAAWKRVSREDIIGEN